MRMSANKIEWSDQQKKVFDAKNDTVVVSAAAGSGKTTVLIERILRILKDEKNPVPADHLLIVTFTRAATSEMRAKLATAIANELKDDPNNTHLQNQQMLLPSANISTIDSFCSTLVRENFDALTEEVAPDFKTIEEGESKSLIAKALGTVMEDLYKEGSDAFSGLVELVTTSTDDTKLEELILKLYNYSRVYPSPEKWLDDALLDYSAKFEEANYTKLVAKYAEQYVDYNIDQIEIILKEIDDNVPPLFKSSIAYNILVSTKESLKAIKCNIENFQFEEALSNAALINKNTWAAAVPDPNTGEPQKFNTNQTVEKAKKLRAKIKGDTSKTLKDFFCATKEQTEEDFKNLRPLAEKLIEAVKMFDAEYKRLKKEQNSLDFSDIELLALSLLVKDPKSETIERTEIAEDIGKQFEEILIDEYQDTNKLQDMIFKAISRDEKNLFMVGDIKQSIYGFRLAMPDIFNERRNTSTHSLTLGTNYRSRKGILDFVNFIFENIMTPECGDIKYDENEKLVYSGNFNEEQKEKDVELHVFGTKKDADNLKIEAEYIADFITEKVTNNEADYKDFCILMQTIKGKSIVFEKVFKEKGIPVFADGGNSFLESADIEIIISFLKIINNPLLDIPLISVLMSPIYGFTEDDLATLRISNRKSNFYQLVKASPDERYKIFLDDLDRYRKLAISLPAGELIRQIYDDTAFPSIASCMPNGKQRYANLMLLIDYADEYDENSSFGISGFVRHLENMVEAGVEPNSANIISENDNVVKIMSIHKSKGLQFKYCILANSNKEFNTMDLNSYLQLNQKYGIGLKGRDPKTKNMYPTLMHKAFVCENRNNLMSENLRVLYVALTRAKSHLIITASNTIETGSGITSLGSLIEKAKNNSYTYHPYYVSHADSFFKLMLPVLLHIEQCNVLTDALNIPHLQDQEENLNFTCEYHDMTNVETAAKATTTISTDSNKNTIDEIKERMEYEYPYMELANITIKRAASHAANGGFDSRFFATSKPEYCSKDGLSPTARGTALHKFMQFANFENDLSSELQNLVDRKYLTKAEADSISLDKVLKFFESNLYSRIKNSSMVLREKKFAVLVPIGIDDETILIQGIADLIFEEDGELVIVDYKTDRMTDKEKFIEFYNDQLTTYATALEKVLDKPIKSAYLYAFSLDDEIQVF